MTLLQSTLFRVLALVFGVAIFTWGSIVLMADYQRFRAESLTEAWQFQQRQAIEHQQPYHVSEEDWQEAYTNINHALDKISYNPDFWIVRAWIARWRLDQFVLPIAIRQQLQQQIISDYQQAITLRPTWPATYSALAEFKTNIGEVDSVMMQSLQQAAHYGKWIPERQQQIIRTGLKAWPQLDTTTRQTVINTLINSQNWNTGYQLSQKNDSITLGLLNESNYSLTASDKQTLQQQLLNQYAAYIKNSPNDPIAYLGLAEIQNLYPFSTSKDLSAYQKALTLIKDDTDIDVKARVVRFGFLNWGYLSLDEQNILLTIAKDKLLQPLDKKSPQPNLEALTIWQAIKDTKRQIVLCINLPTDHYEAQYWCNRR